MSSGGETKGKKKHRHRRRSQENAAAPAVDEDQQVADNSASNSASGSEELCDRCIEHAAVTKVVLDDGDTEVWCQACATEYTEEEKAKSDGTYDFRVVSKLHYDNLFRVFATAPYEEYAALCADRDAGLEMIRLVIQLMLYEDKHLDFLTTVLVHEVETVADEWSLFVNNGVGVRFVTAYIEQSTHEYLEHTLGPLVREVCASPDGYEVDVNKLRGDEVVNENRARLGMLAQRFFDAVVASIDACPLDLRMFLASLRSVVETRFPGQGKPAVGSFVFLRLFCPAIVSPEQYKLLPDGDTPSAEARRALVLVTKILQNSARAAAGDSTSLIRDLNLRMTSANEEKLSQFLTSITKGRVDDANKSASLKTNDVLKTVESVTVMSELLQRANLHFGSRRKGKQQCDYFEDLQDLFNEDQPIADGKFVRLGGGGGI